MKVVVDTNILISAIFWKGNEAKLIEAAENKKISLVLSLDILLELKKVLTEKFPNTISRNETSELIEHFISISELVQPKTRIKAVKEDPEDNKFLECAIDAHADVIVSGDTLLLKLKAFKGIPIKNTKTVLEELK